MSGNFRQRFFRVDVMNSNDMPDEFGQRHGVDIRAVHRRFLIQGSQFSFNLFDSDTPRRTCRFQRLAAMTTKVHAVSFKHACRRQVFRHNQADRFISQITQFFSAIG
ncbi:hypothetical protein SDC9_198474 [bioreactor metagenome]|uniref:Uncharacterized protein n=1 Tax=bioreactor metagenome TaxID=1076179 RepID=A0A645IHS6_9ZZZZ